MLTLMLWFCALIHFGAPKIGCRDENNNVVDWYYLYKLPVKISDGPSHAGVRYTFITPNEANNWQLSNRNINETDSIPGRTLDTVLKDSKDLLVLLYNDEPPLNKTDEIRGHAKGVVVTDGSFGFWLIHSVPKYPPELGQSYTYPETGKKYGQSFLCISMTADQMEFVGQQLLLNEPHVYSFNAPAILRDRFPLLVQAGNMKNYDKPPHWNIVELKSRAGVAFHSFAKNRLFRKELYADLIAPALQVDLFVESWQRGSGDLPSDCSTSNWKVLNVKKVSIGKRYRFTTLDDHSKWAVSTKGFPNYVCVGDINRQEHQKMRGGGSVCSQLTAASTVYRNTVEDAEQCNNLSYVPNYWSNIHL
ncbi:deoxyribonuclease-2-beta [Toxorhynchites rutilus septentrionalis]|uniref:deoxyribonuclease-2-beta n=1 Tax=Toxorhynchites rutilus septentrionalis TaxID=329112 RepID=UPI00247AC877|nr:deoxyribonuclease-2-beta [Toxorhynchites rutilus septentrionalis]